MLKNRVAQETEDAIVAMGLEQPAFGQLRVANELKKRGLSVSPAGVRCVWQRHEIICERFHKTVLNEFYRVAFRKKVYRSLDELQIDFGLLDRGIQ